jgi:mannose-6-phosphate isomerase
VAIQAAVPGPEQPKALRAQPKRRRRFALPPQSKKARRHLSTGNAPVRGLYCADMYPLAFHPIFKERVWGGRKLETLYGKPLPPKAPIGESWEITDRPEGVSVVANGPFAGQDLRWLMEHQARDLLGDAPSQNGRFPLLIKILDAREKLSLQVHPPASRSAALGGEPKTEMWYVADADPDADIYVGLQGGVTRAEFERKIKDGSVAECFHRHAVKAGDAMFLPSGRVHALGGGNVIFEIQQNSDTTYRVFDWNRVGLDGQPRALHIREALESIAFEDFEPPLVQTEFTDDDGAQVRELVRDPLFTVQLQRWPDGFGRNLGGSQLRVLAVIRGELSMRAADVELVLRDGQFGLLPAALNEVELRARGETTFLEARPGTARRRPSS